MFEITVDHMMSLFFVLGLGQLVWISAMLAKRGIAPEHIWQSSMPLFSVWVLAWPIYVQIYWLFLPLMALLMIAIWSHISKRFLWQRLHTIWGGFRAGNRSLPWAMLSFALALAIAVAFFQSIPEFGFGLALTACLAFPLGELLDRMSYIKLGFPLHPEQTLVGHIGLVAGSALLCSWSINLYHGIAWQQLLIATLIAGMAASLCRALLPKYWSLPVSILAMGWILWLL